MSQDPNEEIVEQILKQEAMPPDPGEIHETDLGNARRLVRKHGSDIRHVTLWDQWLIWDGKRWAKDETGQITRLAKDVVMSIYDEAKSAPNADRREALAKHAIKSESEKYRRAMVSAASSEPGIPALPRDLDQDQWLFNCLNGVIDLRTGKLFPHRRTDLITKLSPVHYDPDTKAPLWELFLTRITGGDQSLMGYLQKAVGYSLSGDTREQCFFLLYGTGENGKSTFVDTIGAMLGDYSSTADFSTFMLSKHDGIRNDIARLMGVRFVSAIEAKGQRRFDEVLLKHLTGQDIVTARFLFREFFEFRPVFKLWVAANHKPRIDGVDHAMWRRVRLIPFEVKIQEQERIKNFADKLKSELPGILAWAVNGCLESQKAGLVTPDKVKVATTGYREECDILGGFLDDCCIIDPKATVEFTALYARYTTWCAANSEKPSDGRWFARYLTERGYEGGKNSGKRIRKGLCLI